MAISVGAHGLQCLCGDIANDVVTETCVSLGGETYVHSLEPAVRGPSSRGTPVAVSTLGAQILISKYHSPKKKKKKWNQNFLEKRLISGKILKELGASCGKTK